MQSGVATAVTAIKTVLVAQQPLAPRELMRVMEGAGHEKRDVQAAVQLLFERGQIIIDDAMWLALDRNKVSD